MKNFESLPTVYWTHIEKDEEGNWLGCRRGTAYLFGQEYVLYFEADDPDSIYHSLIVDFLDAMRLHPSLEQAQASQALCEEMIAKKNKEAAEKNKEVEDKVVA